MAYLLQKFQTAQHTHSNTNANLIDVWPTFKLITQKVHNYLFNFLSKGVLACFYVIDQVAVTILVCVKFGPLRIDFVVILVNGLDFEMRAISIG